VSRGTNKDEQECQSLQAMVPKTRDWHVVVTYKTLLASAKLGQQGAFLVLSLRSH